MGLSADDILAIETLLAPATAVADVYGELRRRFPQLSLTRCDASDVGGEQAFREYPSVSLYLIDGADHCWRLTTDAERATGLVLAQRKEGA